MAVPDFAIIGSQDVEPREWLDEAKEVRIRCTNRTVSATIGALHGTELIVMPRNGEGRPIPPHAIDYRSNIEALAKAGARKVMTTSMVGTLRPSIPEDSLLLLDQFIDFTRNRQFTYFGDESFGFADMTQPFCPSLREDFLNAAAKAEITLAPSGCYMCVPGPRFETAAEVRMYAQLGADVIGHTTASDCVMAREAGMCFVTIAGVITLGAGLSNHAMKAQDWHAARRRHAYRFRQLVAEVVLATSQGMAQQASCSCQTAAPLET